MRDGFRFKELTVYQASLRFYAWIVPVAEQLARTDRYATDQLRRAALSIVLNIAEGAGLWRRGNKMRHYEYARGSAFETGALLDVLRIAGVATAADIGAREAELSAIAAILTRLIQRYDSNPTPTPTPTPT